MELIEYDYSNGMQQIKSIAKKSESKAVKSSVNFLDFLIYNKANLKIYFIPDICFAAFVLAKKWINIYEVCVVADSQKKGLGTLMMNFIIDYAQKNNFEKIKLRVDKDNQSVNDFYFKFGFKIVGNKNGDSLLELNFENEEKLF